MESCNSAKMFGHLVGTFSTSLVSFRSDISSKLWDLGRSMVLNHFFLSLLLRTALLVYVATELNHRSCVCGVVEVILSF